MLGGCRHLESYDAWSRLPRALLIPFITNDLADCLFVQLADHLKQSRGQFFARKRPIVFVEQLANSVDDLWAKPPDGFL
jgi:hypothetical protein